MEMPKIWVIFYPIYDDTKNKDLRYSRMTTAVMEPAREKRLKRVAIKMLKPPMRAWPLSGQWSIHSDHSIKTRCRSYPRKCVYLCVQSCYRESEYRLHRSIPEFKQIVIGWLSRIDCTRQSGLGCPFQHGRELFKMAMKPKMNYWVEKAGHNNLIWVAGSGYWNTLTKFAVILDKD